MGRTWVVSSSSPAWQNRDWLWSSWNAIGEINISRWWTGKKGRERERDLSFVQDLIQSLNLLRMWRLFCECIKSWGALISFLSNSISFPYFFFSLVTTIDPVRVVSIKAISRFLPGRVLIQGFLWVWKALQALQIQSNFVKSFVDSTNQNQGFTGSIETQLWVQQAKSSSASSKEPYLGFCSHNGTPVRVGSARQGSNAIQFKVLLEFDTQPE